MGRAGAVGGAESPDRHPSPGALEGLAVQLALGRLRSREDADPIQQGEAPEVVDVPPQALVSPGVPGNPRGRAAPGAPRVEVTARRKDERAQGADPDPPAPGQDERERV